MHRRVYEEFERICGAHNIRGAVLEVGARPSDDCLLNMKVLAKATEKIGIDLEGPYDFRDFKVLKANGNAMDCFSDGRFDAVLCNAVIEHDRYFWRTLAEIKRVTKPGGLIVIGAPGFAQLRLERVKAVLRRLPGARWMRRHQYLNLLYTSTLTFQVHNHPGDYYRFSPQAFREVILEGLEDVEVCCVMLPPRILGAGRKPSVVAP